MSKFISPTTMDNDDELSSWAALVALDAIDADDQELVRALREQHPEFDDMVAEFAATAADLAQPIATSPPPELKDAIFARLDDIEPAAAPERSGETEQTGQAESPASVTSAATAHDAALASVTALRPKSQPPSSNRYRMFVSLAAAFTLLAVGGVAWQYGLFSGNGAGGDAVVASPDDTGKTTSAPGSDTVLATATVAGGEISLEHAADADTGVVRLDNIPAPEPGRAYQMWLVGEDGAKSAGVMERSDITPHMEAEVDGLKTARAFMISVEPSGGSTTPSQNEVVTFTLARG